MRRDLKQTRFFFYFLIFIDYCYPSERPLLVKYCQYCYISLCAQTCFRFKVPHVLPLILFVIGVLSEYFLYAKLDRCLITFLKKILMLNKSVCLYKRVFILKLTFILASLEEKK